MVLGIHENKVFSFALYEKNESFSSKSAIVSPVLHTVFCSDGMNDNEVSKRSSKLTPVSGPAEC